MSLALLVLMTMMLAQGAIALSINVTVCPRLSSGSLPHFSNYESRILTVVSRKMLLFINGFS